MSNKRIFKVGIAGYGIVGKVRHKSLNKCSNIRVVAICDKNFKTNSFKNNIHYFTNYKRLLKEQKIIIYLGWDSFKHKKEITIDFMDNYLFKSYKVFKL